MKFLIFVFQIRLNSLYSATSASLLEIKVMIKILSPYAFTKTKNLEMLENLKRWYNFKSEIIYFYNVYGPMTDK